MRTKLAWLSGLVAAALLTVMSVQAQQAVPPGNAALPEMPKQTTRTGKHVNRVIDMWLKNQPVYYAQTSGGAYEDGKKLAATKADYITYEMEHGPLDFKELREFMRGLVEAGPTRTGHKTPAVVEWFRDNDPQEFKVRYKARKTHLQESLVKKRQRDENLVDDEDSKVMITRGTDPTLNTSARSYGG